MDIKKSILERTFPFQGPCRETSRLWCPWFQVCTTQQSQSAHARIPWAQDAGGWSMMATCNLWSCWFNGMKCHAYGYCISYGIVAIAISIIATINHSSIFWGDLWGRKIPCNVLGGSLTWSLTGPYWTSLWNGASVETVNCRMSQNV